MKVSDCPMMAISNGAPTMVGRWLSNDNNQVVIRQWKSSNNLTTKAKWLSHDGDPTAVAMR